MGAAGRVELPVVDPVELLLAVPDREPLFHGPHMNSAPTISTAATMAAIRPPLTPLRRSSSRVRLFKSSCIANPPMFRTGKTCKNRGDDVDGVVTEFSCAQLQVGDQKFV